MNVCVCVLCVCVCVVCIAAYLANVNLMEPNKMH